MYNGKFLKKIISERSECHETPLSFHPLLFGPFAVPVQKLF